MTNDNSKNNEILVATNIALSLKSCQKSTARNLLHKNRKDAQALSDQQITGSLSCETIEQSRKGAADALDKEQKHSASALKKEQETAADKLKDSADNLDRKLHEKDQLISWLSGGYSFVD